MKRRNNPEIIAGYVASTGAIVAGSGFTVVRNSAGSYTITFPKDFRVIAGSASSASNGFPAGAVPSGSALAVATYNSNTQVATDINFSFIAIGYGSGTQS